MAFWVALVLPLSAVISLVYGGVLTWLPLIIGLFVLPLLDEILPRNRAVSFTGQNSWSLLWLYAPIQMGIIYFALSAPHPAAGSVGAALALGLNLGMVTGGTGITLAHELIHRRTKLEKWAGLALFAMVNYAH